MMLGWLTWLMRQELDSLISAIGGVLFAEISSVWLPPLQAWPVRIVAVVGFIAVLWYAVFHKRPPMPSSHPRSARAIRTYVLCVALEIVAIPLGALLFVEVLRQPAVILPWVVIVAGLHFLPFGNAFGTPLSDRLGGVLFGLGILGGALVLRWSPLFSPWTGVAAGVVLLCFAVAAARVRDLKAPTGSRLGAR
jgi:hypothetical protein